MANAFDDGEERVIATAQHIVRTLDDTMTDDMLQILSKFDGRFSTLNGSLVSSRKQLENQQQSQGVPHNLEATLQSAEEIVMQWDMESSDAARQSMIWDCPQEEINTYLQAVDDVQGIFDSLSHTNNTALASRAQTLVQLAMARLEEEFRHMLVQRSESVSPDWLLDHFSDSFKSTANAEDSVEVASQVEFGDEEGDEEVPVADPVGDSFGPTLYLLPPDIVPDLHDIAQRMVKAGYQRECCQVYATVRKTVLEESLYRLGVEKTSIDEVQKMTWESLESKIKKWIQAMKVAVKVLFASERRLCDQIVLPPVRETCFAELSKPAITDLLHFAEAIAISRRSPEKLFKILDIYETLRDLLPEVDTIFSGESCFSVRSEAAGIVMRLGEAARGTFAEFENAIQRDTSRNAVAGGAVHPLTRYVMNYITFLFVYMDTLEQLFGGNRQGPNVNGLPDATADHFQEDDGRGGRDQERTPLAAQTMVITHVLQTNLEGKSKLYKDNALTYLFLMNNVHYIVQKVRCSEEVRTLLGDDWVKKRTGFVRQCATNYQRAAWGKVFACLRDEGINGSGGSLSSGVSRVVLKDRFKNFNAAFDDIHKAQTAWIVPDPQLRDELRISIEDRLLPAYRSFHGRYGNYLDTGKHPEKYIKYTSEDLERLINDLFEGTTVSQKGRGR
eukprot:TRINITY_DN464_c0_g1_i1.p1 TRINITY_DN464_c0_g1~~TRINITY_DN464_c0_g1_i1.p1  ORF type:complete len:672 (-),score=145.52 TRINITY_DN464_c0_g1_i1:382-2397(-)